jgi:translation initiation factor 1
MSKKKGNGNDRVVYQEFGNNDEPEVEETPTVPPNQQQVRIQVSRKGRGGKSVTIVSGLQHSEADLTTLAKKLKSQCGSGGTVKDGNVEMQGEHGPKLLEILVSLGYKAKISGG